MSDIVKSLQDDRLEPEEEVPIQGTLSPHLQDAILPIPKIILLMILTSGFYQIYWLYKVWKNLKAHGNLAVSPFWRAFFSYIFIFNLFKRIQHIALEIQCPPLKHPILLGLGLFISALMYNALPIDKNNILIAIPFSLGLVIFDAVLMSVVQANLNLCWRRLYPGLPEKFSLRYPEIIFLLLGLIMSLILFFALLVSFLDIFI